jgi:UDP:flavonoid glycosyltransferase YjiC (YdhE family)
VTLIVTTGRDRDPAAFDPQPEHVRIERYVPQSLLFPRCDAVVAHGGTGTVLAALAHGLLLVLAPVAADQPDNARRCEHLGVARMVPPDGRTPGAFRARCGRCWETTGTAGTPGGCGRRWTDCPGRSRRSDGSNN